LAKRVVGLIQKPQKGGLKMRLRLKYEIASRFGTQSQFAKSCGKNDNWISRIVCGRQYPNPEEMAKIEKKLNISNLRDFLQDDNNPKVL